MYGEVHRLACRTMYELVLKNMRNISPAKKTSASRCWWIVMKSRYFINTLKQVDDTDNVSNNIPYWPACEVWQKGMCQLLGIRFVRVYTKYILITASIIFLLSLEEF